MTKISIILVLVIAFSNLANGQDLSQEEIQKAILITNDVHYQIVIYDGPYIYRNGDKRDDFYYLKAWRNAEGGESSNYLIYIVAVFDDWADIDRAVSFGKPLPLRQISAKTGQCSTTSCKVQEHVVIDMKPTDMYIASVKGLSFKVAGPNGEAEFSIPKIYFKTFLDFVQRDAEQR